MKHYLEVVYRICNEATGDVAVEVGPDPDGLGLVEIRTLTDDGEVGARVCLSEDALELLIDVLQRVSASKSA